jgi:predicted DNA-binding transcriptional regulator AlpA
MLETTIDIIRSSLRADPTLSVPDRARLLAILRQGVDLTAPTKAPADGQRVVRRKDVSFRLSISLRSVDKLSADGVLPKVVLPGRTRAIGFLESDLQALIEGRCSSPAPMLPQPAKGVML